MRNLTIERRKTFVASLVKMQVYIEDPDTAELIINNVPCRKLGDIKNNESKTFSIDDNEAKVFVIGDKLSKDYCFDFYQLPAGQNDIILTGKNQFNLASGNAYRFDNNQSSEVVQSRKKGTKKGVFVLIAALLVGAIIGYVISTSILFGFDAEPKIFNEKGMSITLTDEFKSVEIGNFTNCYDSSKVAVFALKEDFSLLEGLEDYSLTQYGDLVIQNNGYTSSLKSLDGLTYFVYQATPSQADGSFTYYSFVFKSYDAFWLIQFATKTADADEYGTKIIEWAKSVSFE